MHKHLCSRCDNREWLDDNQDCKFGRYLLCPCCDSLLEEQEYQEQENP